MTCSQCKYSQDGHVGQDCPMKRNGVRDTFSGGCNLAEVRQQAEERLPDVPIYDKSEIKLESDLQRLCEQELSRREIVYLHLSPKAREKAGWPDLVFCQDGAPCAIELKGPTGKLSDDQKKILEAMEKNGWEVAVFRSFDAFKSFLDAK